jgi:hypothetical protein
MVSSIHLDPIPYLCKDIPEANCTNAIFTGFFNNVFAILATPLLETNPWYRIADI